jgi:hypothetical protein
VYIAVLKFLEFEVEGFKIYVTGFGDPEQVRKVFKRACYRKHITVKYEPERFVPLVIREFGINANVILTCQEINPRPLYEYTLMNDATGTPMLRIMNDIGQKDLNLVYVGPFFQFLLHGLKAPRERYKYDPNNTKAARESRRVAKEQAEKLKKQRGVYFSPEQIRIREDFQKHLLERGRKKLGAIRRHARVRKLRKIKLPLPFATEADQQHLTPNKPKMLDPDEPIPYFGKPKVKRIK